MEICEYKNYIESEILKLYSSVGWTAYTDDPASLEAGFENSLLTLVCYDGDRLVGIIRTVGDGNTIVYIQDVLVDPSYQRKGIGSALIRAVLDRFRNVRQIVLSTDAQPSTIAFYESLGFRKMEDMGCCSFMRA